MAEITQDYVPGDYSLTGKTTPEAIRKGLAEAKWYASPVPKDKMRELLERKDGPAFRDTVLWFALIFGFGILAYATWGTWWAIPALAVYGVLYASSSDSRWHEAGHGTAFKTDWMNNVLYEIASFMVTRESVVWRWSHTRHHSDTIIVGRDPEIAVPRPTKMRDFVGAYFGIGGWKKYWTEMPGHAIGRFTADELTFIPDSAKPGIIWRARIYLAIYAAVIGLAVWTGSILPLLYIGLTPFYGSWLMVVYGYTQHAGLAENVLDHRLNCRTVYMNPINRYLYWNMNYHVEHHMFPLVPYHALPRLHALVKPDMPKPYNGILEAYREIIPAVLRQVNDPGWHVRREIPTPTVPAMAPSTAAIFTSEGRKAVNGWIEIGPAGLLNKEDVLRFDHEGHTYAVYRTADNRYFASEGICTHGNAHLADGFVTGNLIECPKHNGRFDIRDGSPARLPVCVALKTYKVKVEHDKILLDVTSAGGLGVTAPTTTYSFTVVSNDNVATFIKELVLEPAAGSPKLVYKPGQYMQFDIPPYEQKTLAGISVKAPFEDVWKRQHVFGFVAENGMPQRRNYSLATNPVKDRQVRFNIRIATPPAGQKCNAGVGSSYMFELKPGDTVTAIGPFGDFQIKDSNREMVYIGGGAGMAPLRSHLSYLLESQQTERKISFWYGARSKQELFYSDYFETLARDNPNFSFHAALSEPQPDDGWTGHTGFIHEVALKAYLVNHPDPRSVEYYLCGPPPMIKACVNMLRELGVGPSQIAYDEF
jgi:Na+-transporting NADH:ubiquinone oxidoreductase subunit F